MKTLDIQTDYKDTEFTPAHITDNDSQFNAEDAIHIGTNASHVRGKGRTPTSFSRSQSCERMQADVDRHKHYEHDLVEYRKENSVCLTPKGRPQPMAQDNVGAQSKLPE